MLNLHMLNAKTQLTAIAIAIAIALAGAAATAAPLEGNPRAEQRLDLRMERMAERLDLSAAQRTEIRAILDDYHQAADMDRARLRERIDAVLTAEQRMRRDEQRAARMTQRIERMAERLGLSEAQRAEVAAVLAEKRSDPNMSRSNVRERMAAVLTDEQRAYVRGMREGRGNRGAGGRSGRDW